MRVLIIGGTRFSGRALAIGAMDAGYEVTCVHRGSEGRTAPAGACPVIGDRDPRLGDGVRQLQQMVDDGARWDAVVDMCGFVPRVVGASADALRDACDRFVFVSSVSVYPTGPEGSPDEDSETLTLDDPTTEEIGGGNYGGLKVLCEAAARERFGDRLTVVRPGLIVGPDDPTDRFTSWPRRLKRGGRVLVPQDSACPARWIDARDLAAFMLRCASGEAASGTYNALAPREPIGFGAFLDAVERGVGIGECPVERVARDDAWLEAHGVRAWMEIPVYTGAGESSMGRAVSARAFDAGLRARPLEETAADTLVWDLARGSPALKAGLDPARERELLGG